MKQRQFSYEMKTMKIILMKVQCHCYFTDKCKHTAHASCHSLCSNNS